MKKLILFLLVLLNVNIISAQSRSNNIENHLIIKVKNQYFKPEKIDLSKNILGVPNLDKLNLALNLKKIQSIGQFKITHTFLLIFNNSLNIDLTIREYSSLKEIEFVEPDFIASGGGEKYVNPNITPNDTYFNRQWGLVNNGTMTGIGSVKNDADVDMELAWNIQTGDPNIIIAVSDSGLKMNHPDIASKIWTNPLEIADNEIDDDNNGLIDDIHGWDWVNDDNDPTDDLGHGTNVAGIIGAIPNNSNLYTGVNWNSKIMPLKVLNASNLAETSNMVNSIYYAIDNGAKIVSMSIGGTSPSLVMSDAINTANLNNVILVFCMMNTNNNTIYYPAGYSTLYSNVIAVGSTNPNDSRTAPFFWNSTSGSNFGNHINVVAPGNYIYGLDYNSNTNANSYWGGTSQATPLVAGIASLILSQNQTLTPNQIRTIIQNTSQDQVGNPLEDQVGFDKYMGYGRVNAYSALQATPVLAIDEMSSSSDKNLTILNPVKNCELKINSNNIFIENCNISIYSFDGKLILNKKIQIEEGINTIPFNYTSGDYIVSLKSDNYSKIFKVVTR